MSDTSSGSAEHPPQARRQQWVPKAATLVAQSIVDEITEFGYAPGHRLPPEQEMLRQYGVARGTLREALRVLEQHGVIRVRSGPSGGPVVQDPGASDLASTLALIMQMKRISVSSVLELRTLMEPLLSALTAKRATPEDLARLNENLTTMQDCIDDDRAFLRANFRFHELVADASGNILLATIVEALDHILDRKMSIQYSPAVRRAIYQAHAKILAKIQESDSEGAEQAMTEHLYAIERYWAKSSTRVLEDKVQWREALRH